MIPGDQTRLLDLQQRAEVTGPREAFQGGATSRYISGHPLALTLLTIAGCLYLLWLGAKAVLRTRPQAAQIVGRVSGAVMIAIALGLIVGQFG